MRFQWGYWPMRYAIKGAGALASLLILGSCSSVGGGKDGNAAPTLSSAPNVESTVSDIPVKIGAPYTIGNMSYTPVDVTSYDEVGYASHYGAEMGGGHRTANGEIFIPRGVTAAHKTLPMPSYVEVTALDTGRTILVRVNDRGPFANDRLIDLSEGAAQQLGIVKQGVAGVRVRRVNPPEQERAVLREGMRTAERIDTPESLLRVLRDNLAKQPRPSAPVSTSPDPQPATASVAAPKSHDGPSIDKGADTLKHPKPPTSGTATTKSYIVQVAAFSSRSRADALARKIGANIATSADGKLFRVRFGPYSSEADAKRGLTAAEAGGYPQAIVTRN